MKRKQIKLTYCLRIELTTTQNFKYVIEAMRQKFSDTKISFGNNQIKTTVNRNEKD